MPMPPAYSMGVVYPGVYSTLKIKIKLIKTSEQAI